MKYGPAVMGETPPVLEPAGAVGQPVGPIVDVSPAGGGLAESPGVSVRDEGPIDQGARAENLEIDTLKLEIRDFRRVAENPESKKPEVAAAKARLGQLAAVEYGRPDGGRKPIKAALARAGFPNPGNG